MGDLGEETFEKEESHSTMMFMRTPIDLISCFMIKRIEWECCDLNFKKHVALSIVKAKILEKSRPIWPFFLRCDCTS